MKKLNTFILLAVLLVSYICLHAEAVLTLYLKHPPVEVTEYVKEHVNPDEIANTIGNYMDTRDNKDVARKAVQGQVAQGWLPKVGGVLGVYQGYFDYSNNDGQFLFPLRHTDDSLDVIISSKIKLKMIKGHTVSHPRIVLTDPAATKRYRYEKKLDNNKTYYWQVTEVKELPEGNTVGPKTLLIVTNPANIYVALGDFMTTAGAQKVLPHLYVVGAQNNNDILATTMDIKRYFEQIEHETKKVDDTKTQKFNTTG